MSSKHPSHNDGPGQDGPVNWARRAWLNPALRDSKYEEPHTDWHPRALEAYQQLEAEYAAKKGQWNEPGGPPMIDPKAICRACRKPADGHGHCWCCGIRTEDGHCADGCPFEGDIHQEDQCRKCSGKAS